MNFKETKVIKFNCEGSNNFTFGKATEKTNKFKENFFLADENRKIPSCENYLEDLIKEKEKIKVKKF